MHKALRVPQTATPEKKEDKGQTVISPQELLADADALLLKFREEIGASDFRDVTATPTKGKDSTKGKDTSKGKDTKGKKGKPYTAEQKPQ